MSDFKITWKNPADAKKRHFWMQWKSASSGGYRYVTGPNGYHRDVNSIVKARAILMAEIKKQDSYMGVITGSKGDDGYTFGVVRAPNHKFTWEYSTGPSWVWESYMDHATYVLNKDGTLGRKIKG